jgi:CIC family chloride channel protein
LNGSMALKLMAVLVVLKLVSVALSYASGNAGGIFGPALFIGAMLGGSVGTIAHRFFPAYTASAGAYALVGMGTAFAGIVRAPMTSVLMIFEMTQDYSVIVPLMISNLVSLFIASQLQPEPIYDALAVQDGIHLPSHASRRHSQRTVLAVMRPPAESLPAEIKVGDAISRIRESKVQSWLVTESNSRVLGVVNLTSLQQGLDAAESSSLRDLVTEINFPHVHIDQSLDLALQRMGTNHLQILPVVSRADVHNLLGVVTLSDVLGSYGLGAQDSSTGQ